MFAAAATARPMVAGVSARASMLGRVYAYTYHATKKTPIAPLENRNAIDSLTFRYTSTTGRRLNTNALRGIDNMINTSSRSLSLSTPTRPSAIATAVKPAIPTASSAAVINVSIGTCPPNGSGAQLQAGHGALPQPGVPFVATLPEDPLEPPRSLTAAAPCWAAKRSAACAAALVTSLNWALAPTTGREVPHGRDDYDLPRFRAHE